MRLRLVVHSCRRYGPCTGIVVFVVVGFGYDVVVVVVVVCWCWKMEDEVFWSRHVWMWLMWM